ncbi:CPCC family cysteine-rich protein [Peribacillus sp. YIM B13481]
MERTGLRICFWEDDNYQYEYPDEDVANKISFRESQQN